jgi:hypothetical protein
MRVAPAFVSLRFGRAVMKSYLVVAIALAMAAADLTAYESTAPGRVLGQPAEASLAQRAIVVEADTATVDVAQGESVRFESGRKFFSWRFDGPPGAFRLNQVAPPGALSHLVQVQVHRTATRP